MKRKEITRRCKCICNRELPSRYKGREKIFFNAQTCRKSWHSMTKREQAKRLKEMQDDIEREKNRI